MSQTDEPGKRFAADIMLGRLARWLRVLGFDARSMVIANRFLIASLLFEGFIPVTRREKFRDREGVIFIRGNHHFEQLRELISLAALGREEVRLFSRCILCNAALEDVLAEVVFGVVPDHVFETVSDFRRCPQCARVYWPGSHRRKMVRQLETLTGWSLLEGEEGGR